MSFRLRLLSSSRSQVEGVWTHLCRSVGFQSLWSPSPRSVDGLYSGGLGFGGGVVLEVTELPQVTSSMRRLVRKRPISRLVAVEMSSRDQPLASGSTSLYDALKWVSEERPSIVPSLQTGGTTAERTAEPQSHPPGAELKEDGLGIKGIREVVLAYGEDVGRYARMSSALGAVGSPAEGLPDVWEVPCPVTGDMVAFRLLPSSLSAVVVGVDCLATCREELIKRSVPFESIGVTGASEGHLLLASPLLDGLDVRFCEHDARPSIFFNEGTEVMMDGVLEELNPALTRAAAQQESMVDGGRVEYRNKETDGHCWSEFHSQIRKPSGWLKKRPQSRTRSS